MAREADLGPSSSAPARRPAADAPAVGGGNPLQRLWRFAHESASELKKVEWPGQNQVVQGTVVVLVACIIVGTYLWVNDRIWSEVVQKVLLK
ncbi:MAG TPA: preprotein translocase subunit SecE [Gaiellaceae bacterium]|nr:preprotein translocase subunit SecE [Gaiellaceae bacterium]